MRISLEYQELHSILQRWGDWQERHYFDDNLPKQSSHTLIYADQPAGHKILCAEMPKSVWFLNYHINHLKSVHKDALFLEYAINVKPVGGFWTPKEKAEKFGWGLNSFRLRLTRARRALHRNIFTNTLKRRQIESSKGEVSNTVTLEAT